MNMESLSALFSSFVVSVFLSFFTIFPSEATAAFETDDTMSIEAEFAYRQKIELEAAGWAKDLMFMYRDTAADRRNRVNSGQRVGSELAWTMLMGHAALATFDFKHSELAFIGQIPLGSTSRLVASLRRSKNFWLEVRNQCLELKRIETSPSADYLRKCKERFEGDINTSQIIGSNVSLFVGGGVVISVGTRLYRRYASQWVATRVLPFIPAFARSKWVAAGLLGAVIVLPTGYLVASVSEEQRTQQVFLDDLETSLSANRAETLAESVLRQSAIKQEREVLEFALWIGQRLPKGTSETEAERFLFELRLTAPHFQNLKASKSLLEERRLQIEAELSAIPNVKEKLQALADSRATAKLTGNDAILFRKAQYLAALRLALRAINADQQSSPSGD